jgi:NADH-quinone oxidoreductase subunit K
MKGLELNYFTDIGLILCFLGICGILVNKRNIIISIISIEIMFYGLNFYLITISLYLDDISGQILSLFILTIAAAESAIALALVMSYFKIFKDILLDYN